MAKLLIESSIYLHDLWHCYADACCVCVTEEGKYIAMGSVMLTLMG